MSDWWTYHLSDFLLFSPAAYWALFEQENTALWPAPILAVGLACVLIAAALRPTDRSCAVAFALIAVAWAWVGWSFMWHRYAGINWAARYATPAFVLQAAIMFGLGIAQRFLSTPWGRTPMRFWGIAIIGYAALLHPLWSVLSDRPLSTAEVVGLAPDPTAIATVGAAFVVSRGVVQWIILIVPTVWLATSATTMFAMGEPQAWALTAVAAAGPIVALFGRRRTDLDH